MTEKEQLEGTIRGLHHALDREKAEVGRLRAGLELIAVGFSGRVKKSDLDVKFDWQIAKELLDAKSD